MRVLPHLAIEVGVTSAGVAERPPASGCEGPAEPLERTRRWPGAATPTEPRCRAAGSRGRGPPLCRRTSTPCCGAGVGTSVTATRRVSSTSSTATYTSGWPPWPAVKHGIPWPQLGHPVHLRVAQGAWDLPPDRKRSLLVGACLTANGVGEPCAGEPHAGFDRGHWRRDTATAVRTGEKPSGQRRSSAIGIAEPAAYLSSDPFERNLVRTQPAALKRINRGSAATG